MLSDAGPDSGAVRRWRILQGIVDHALELDGDAREPYLATACSGDPALLVDARRLIIAAQDAEHFLEQPAADLLADTTLEGKSRRRPRAGEHADPVPAEQAPASPQLGVYRLVERLAVGGMGEVWAAERDDGEFERRVAIKMLAQRFDDDDARARLRAERQILARLEHPHIARLLDGGTAPDGRPFLVMELIDGEPIDRFCAVHRLRVAERLRLMLDLCRAVACAHEHGLVHRDLKPHNVLVTPGGGVKLVDFGIAKALSPQVGERAPDTVTGRRLMTPGYASPEQIRGRPISTATDVHGLGILLYELITGCRPFIGPGGVADPKSSGIRGDEARAPLYSLEQAVCEGRIMEPCRAVAEPRLARRLQVERGESISLRPEESLGTLRRRLRQGLESVMLKALAKRPEQRYRSAVELTAALQRIVDQEQGDSAAAYGMRHRAGGLAATLLLLLAALTLSGYPREMPEPVSFLSPLEQLVVPIQVHVLAILPVENAADRKQQDAIHVLLEKRLYRALSSAPGIRLTGQKSLRPLLGIQATSSAIAYRVGSDLVFRSVVEHGEEGWIWWAALEDGVDSKRLMGWKLEAVSAEELVSRLDQVVTGIIEILGTEPPRLGLPPEPDLNAYGNLAKGRYLIHKGEAGAEPYLTEAMDQDSSLAAEVRLALGHAYALQASRPGADKGAHLGSSLNEVREALRLDPNYADAWVYLGELLLYFSRDVPAARDALLRGLGLNPSDTWAMRLVSGLATSAGDLELGIRFAEQALELDMLNASPRHWLGRLHYFRGELDAAEYQISAARALSPGRAGAYASLSEIYLQRGDPVMARRLADQESSSLFRLQTIALSELALGQADSAQHALDQLIADWRHEGAVQIAEVYAARGDVDEAFHWMDIALEQWDPGVVRAWARPAFRPLMKDPRMMGVLARIGFSPDDLTDPGPWIVRPPDSPSSSTAEARPATEP